MDGPNMYGMFPLAISVPLPSCPNMSSQVQICDSEGIWHIISKGAVILSGFLQESKTVFFCDILRQNTGPNLLRIYCYSMLIFMPLRGNLNSPRGAISSSITIASGMHRTDNAKERSRISEPASASHTN